MMQVRDAYTGASLQIGITDRPNGAGEMMMKHNGSVIVRIVFGARLEAARMAMAQRDADAFGELMFPTRQSERVAA